MNPAYLDTFRQHRKLFLIPIAVAGLLALWTALGAPKLYRSTSTLWLDSPGAPNLQALGAPSPAADGQTMLNELLRTEYFGKTVAGKSELEDYLKEHPSSGWGPGAAVGKLRGTPILDDRIASALGPSRVTSSIQGPHVLEIKFDAATPELAVSTLRVILTQFQEQRTALRRDALAAAQERVVSATKALTAAQESVDAYQRSHTDNDSSDPQLNALRLDLRNAATAVSNATQTLNDASSALEQSGALEGTLQVLDQPSVPTGPTEGKRKMALIVLAGLFGGVVFSVLGIVVLTTGTRALRPGVLEADADEAASTNGHHAEAQVQLNGTAGAPRRTAPARRRKTGGRSRRARQRK